MMRKLMYLGMVAGLTTATSWGANTLTLIEDAQIRGANQVVVGVLRAGAKVRVLSMGGQWHKVRYDNGEILVIGKVPAKAFAPIKAQKKQVGSSGKFKGMVKVTNKKRSRTGKSRLGNNLVSFSAGIQTKEERTKKPYILMGFLCEDNEGQRLLKLGYWQNGNRSVKRITSGNLADKASVLASDDALFDAKIVTNIKANGLTLYGLDSSHISFSIIAWRIELWHDGFMLDSKASPPTAKLKHLNIPDDWHEQHAGPFNQIRQDQ